MEDKLIEYRCQKCPPLVKGALLFKGTGDAVIEIRCPRCKAIVKVETVRRQLNNAYDKAKKMVAAND